MKIVSWNVHGLGKLRDARRLRSKMHSIRPYVLFLMETKVSDLRMKRIRQRCDFINGIEVAADGSRGGLSLSWTHDVNISLISFSSSHIDVHITDLDSTNTWRFKGFYGNPITSQRSHSWNFLRSLNTDPSMSWLVAGDFNEVLYANEKTGGRVRSQQQMNSFRAAMSDCDLTDLGYSGRWYTWEKGRLARNNIRERLDMGMANSSWLSTFPSHSVKHLSHTISNHYPILISTTDSRIARDVSLAFKFDANWILEGDVEGIIQSTWSESEGDFVSKLSVVSYALKNWCRTLNSKRKISADALTSRLEQLSSEDPSDDNLAEILEVKLALNMESDKDELFWEQRARANWFQKGDKNTSFFHKWASFRKRKNTIRRLKRNDDTWVENELDLLELAKDHFGSIFSSSPVAGPSNVLNLVRPSITVSDNTNLNQPISPEEVLLAVKSMAPLKASGPDGFPALFFQQYWSIVGVDLVHFCNMLFSGSASLDGINKTNIVLIPKVAAPSSMDNFRPISLCQVFYKIYAKVLANRLRSLLDKCIDQSQSAFVPGRLITDNILITYELLHSMKIKQSGKKSAFALKLDMAKAYDKVNWGFLRAMMLRLGFADTWVSALMHCVTSVSYLVIINGSVGDSFSPTCGIRQGDPLSPYLFLLCAEGLSSILNVAKSTGSIKGTKAGRFGVPITHLFFADDSILFGQNTLDEAARLKDLISFYESVSGQQVNYRKSSIFSAVIVHLL
ncbi:hypothetical protein HRI_000659600 [Hibiscus trionum]|uniref:Reverse transcriptase domain-containing protein n=1 Tax=Hibiscus trionum TaxID=183268 RepID=A0A9W7LM93_HIBTR|nr:hypothetical protein HRI_000659600 [Hibiscus trionum]